jgi:hypothetical protein
MLAISLRLGITRNPEHLLGGTPLGLEYLMQGKYIGGDERGGFHVAKVNLPLPDPRLRLFIQGKEDLFEEGLSYRPPWAHYLGGYQDRLLGGPLGLPDLCRTVPDGMRHKDYGGEVLR